jgi:hypothetical protein
MLRHAGFEPVKRHQRIAHQPTYRRNDKTDQTDQTDQNKLLAAVAARVNEENDEQRARDVTEHLPKRLDNKKTTRATLQSLLEDAELKLLTVSEKAREAANSDKNIAFLRMHIAHSLKAAILERKGPQLENALQEADAQPTEVKAEEVIGMYKQASNHWSGEVMQAAQQLKQAKDTVGEFSALLGSHHELTQVAADVRMYVEAIEAANPDGVYQEMQQYVQITNEAIRGMKDTPLAFDNHFSDFSLAIDELQRQVHDCVTQLESFARLEGHVTWHFKQRRDALVSAVQKALTNETNDPDGVLKQSLLFIQNGPWSTTKQKLEFFDFARTIEDTLGPASATPAAPVAAPVPTEKDGHNAKEQLERILEGIRSGSTEITTGLTADIAHALCGICGILTENLFSIHADVVRIDKDLAHKGLRALGDAQLVASNAQDNVRKLLKIFEVSYLKHSLNPYNTSSRWFELSGYPLVPHEDVDLHALRKAISDLYYDTQHASALPSQYAYEYIRDVVAYHAHEDKSELQDLVDTANGLIEKENGLMKELSIGAVIPPIPYDPLEQRTKVMITETFESGAHTDAIKMFFDDKHPNVVLDPKAYYESQYDTYKIRANESGASHYAACKRAFSDYKAAYEKFLSVASYDDAVSFYSRIKEADEALHDAISVKKPQGASVVIPESATCSSIKEMLKEEQSRTQPSSIDDFIDALQRTRAISASAYQDLKNAGITATFQYCTDETSDLLSKMHLRIHEYNEVDTTKFLDALALLTKITSNFNAVRKIFFFDGTSTSAVSSLIGLYNEQSKWTQQSSVSNLEDTITLFTIATGTQYRDYNSIFEGDRELKIVLQNAPVKALTFVLSGLLVTGHIHTTVFQMLNAKKKGDDRLRLAVLISISLKIIDSALLAHGILTHTQSIAAEWVRLFQYRARRVNFSDFRQRVELLSLGMKVCYFPPFAAYAKLQTATFESEKAREYCKSEAQTIIRLRKDTVLTRISTQEGGQNLQDLVGKEIGVSFGSTKRRKYAMSPWTAV